MDIFWVILFISFPVFYIYGIVSFVRDVARKGKKESGFSVSPAHAPDLEVPRPQAEYLKNSVGERVIISTPASPGTSLGWYSENSITLLLYVGAFLIVASAAAFVGLAWESIGGVGKALVLSLVCCGFFLAGFASLTNPRIKQAAYTFLGIGTLLIAFVSWGWYGFVLRDAGVAGSVVWFLSSDVTLVLAVGLAHYVQQRWYAYLSSLAVLSGMLSMVYMTGLSDTFYVLSSALSAFLYFGASVAVNRLGGRTQVMFAEPYRVSAQILMPLSLVYGMIIAADRGLLFSFEAVLVGGLGSLYYLMTYLVMKKPIYLAVAQSIFLVSLLLFSRWMGLTTEASMAVVMIAAAIYTVQAFLIIERGLVVEGRNSKWLGLGAAVVLWLSGIVGNFDFGYQSLLAMVLVAIVVYCSWMEKQWSYGWVVGVVTAYFVQYVMRSQLDLPYTSFWYGVVYIGIAVALWSWAILEEQKSPAGELPITKKLDDKTGMLLGVAAIYYLLGMAWSISDTSLAWIGLWVMTTLFLVHAYVRREQMLVYAGVVAFLAGTVQLLAELKTDLEIYPLIFAGIAFGMYALQVVVRGLVYEKPLRTGALLLTSGVPLLFGINDGEYALITSYLAVVLLALDAYLNSDERSGYAASAFGLLTYVWQLARWEVDVAQLYTLAVGTYFLALGYYGEYKTKKAKPQNENAKTDNVWLFYYLGMAAIIVPTFFQMWGTTGMTYAVLMLLYGFGLLSFGITNEHRQFKYAGIAAMVLAVLSQVYGVIAALDWYLVLGVFGLVMLGLAVYLSNKK